MGAEEGLISARSLSTNHVSEQDFEQDSNQDPSSKASLDLPMTCDSKLIYEQNFENKMSSNYALHVSDFKVMAEATFGGIIAMYPRFAEFKNLKLIYVGSNKIVLRVELNICGKIEHEIVLKVLWQIFSENADLIKGLGLGFEGTEICFGKHCYKE